jgi:HSP20 family protein
MNIIKNKKIVNSFGQYIDQLNTLSGGISMARVKVLNKADKMVVQVAAPSVNPDYMQVVVEQNKLIVYATLPPAEDTGTGQQAVSFPLFSQVVQIPFQVAVEQIDAVYQNGYLSIYLPFAEDRLIKRQSIEIRRK